MTPWTVAHQAPLAMEFSREEYWSGEPLSSPRGLPNPGIKPRSSTLQTDSLPSEPPGKSKATPNRHLQTVLWLHSCLPLQSPSPPITQPRHLELFSPPVSGTPSIHPSVHLSCAKSCPTLCDPIDRGPPGSSVHGILQAGTLEWVAISYSRASS